MWNTLTTIGSTKKYTHIWWMAHQVSSLYINIRKNRVYIINILNVRNQCPYRSPNIRHTDTIASLHPQNSHWKYRKNPFISKYIATRTLRCIKYHQQKLKINKLRLNRTLLARRMTNITNLLHQECTAIAFYWKPI